METKNLKVALIQSDLHWENKEANLAMFEEKIWQIEEDVDVIILPEMFNTGFSMDNRLLAEPMNLTTFKWMKQMAAQTNALVLGSFMVKEAHKLYNRLIWMQPDGEYAIYNKRHLFRLMSEDERYEEGQDVLIKNWRGWNICPMVCYDLRFPVWSRNINLDYDLLVYIANWPVPRLNAWDTLLQARAIENLSYCIGVNRIGKDGNEVPFHGHSAAIDFKGNVISHLGQEETFKVVTLEKTPLASFRKKFPIHLDADKFQILEK